LAAAGFLLHPLGLAVLERSWTEPLVVLAVSLCVWSLAVQRKGLLAISVGAVLAIKQYGILWVVPVGSCGRLNVRVLGWAVFLAMAVTLPFILWGPSAIWKGLVTFQVDSPFRGDSLTVLAAVAALTGYQLPSAVGFLVALGVSALTVLRPNCSIPGI